jgi:alkaline phosphatase D
VPGKVFSRNIKPMNKLFGFPSQIILSLLWCGGVGNLHGGDLRAPETSKPAIFHAQGEIAGEVTSSSVLLQSRLTALPGPEPDAGGDIPGVAGVACFEWSTAAGFTDAKRTPWMKAEADADFIVRAKLENLEPATLHFYRVVSGPDHASAKPGPARRFRTLPAAESSTPVSFVMGSCQNYAFFMHGNEHKGRPAPETDRKLGYPAYAAMLALNPDFFIGTGDIVYYDHPATTAAKTLPELRRKWHEQARLPRLIEFFARTPAFWSKDDHDFRFNDADLSGNKLPAPTTGIEIFREQMPLLPASDRSTPTYRTHRINRHLQLWFTEGRDYRSPNQMPDGPEKSIWGKEQRTWLQRTLKASDATWKIIVTPTPMVGPDNKRKQDNHANLGGFRHEADSFFEWLRQTGQTNVLTFCGDRHWQYHSVHPLGVEEFSCGALNDENAIAGIRPGSGSDPEGRIRQPFLYSEPSGGFLHVRLGTTEKSGASLCIGFRNDEGTLLYETTRTAPTTEASKR